MNSQLLHDQNVIIIKSCSDKSLWYSKYIGMAFVCTRIDKEEKSYMTRQPEGFLNYVRFEDAFFIEKTTLIKAQVPPDRFN